MKKWFKYIKRYPSGESMHHNYWIAMQACIALSCLVQLDDASITPEIHRLLWWVGVGAVLNGILMTIMYECVVKMDYWKPNDDQTTKK